MAVFQLGAGITGLVGSSGGTTFKRNKSANVWMNKSRGASRGRNLQNIRLGNNAVIFKSWNFLSNINKAAWNANAAATKVKDKFGNDVNISGVAFQRKCELSGVLVGATNIDPTTFTTDLNPYTIDSATINWSTRHLDVDVTAPDGQVNMCFMLEFTLKNLPAPQFTRRGVFYVEAIDGATMLDLWNPIIEKYPFLNGNYQIRLYTFQVNDTGWSSVIEATDIVEVP
jgi:hypothetical protein